MEDFLSAGAGLIERLKMIQGFRLVDSVAALENVAEMSQVVPAALVLYDSYTPTGETGSGELTQLSQRWYVVVVVRSASSIRTGSGLTTEAGPLIAQVLKHLVGYRITGYTALRLTAAPPALMQAGFGYYPLGFTVQAEVEAL